MRLSPFTHPVALLGAALLALTPLQAQQTVLDFESINWQVTDFGGATFSLTSDPVQSGNQMGQIVNTGTNWEGVFFTLPASIMLDSAKVIQLDFYNPNASNHSVLLKLEKGEQTDVELSQSVQGAGWHSLSFDFSQASIPGAGVTINAEGRYGRMVLFIDGPSATAGTYGIDNIAYPDYSTVYPDLDVEYTQLAWADEFHYTGAVDTSEWFQEIVPPNSWGWFNGEFQHYTNRTDNSYVGNGKLHIVAKRETYTAYGLTKDFTSARLNSNFSFTYGRVDVRAKLPTGDGTWPAIWMLGTAIGNNVHPPVIPWPDCGEIDIMEHWGYEQDVIHGSTHTLSSHGSTVNTNAIFVPHVSDSFHVYSVNWSPDRLTFLIDDVIYYVYEPDIKNAATWPFDDPQFILLNIAMGGAWFDVDPAFVESTMEIDYVRVYQESSVGTAEHIRHKQIRVYPQPAEDELHFAGEALTSIQITDLLGRVVHEQSFGAQNAYTLEVSDWPAGVYIWQVSTQGQMQSGRLLID